MKKFLLACVIAAPSFANSLAYNHEFKGWELRDEKAYEFKTVVRCDIHHPHQRPPLPVDCWPGRNPIVPGGGGDPTGAPEPGTLALAGTALLGLAYRRSIK